jgi:hypothetical protein
MSRKSGFLVAVLILTVSVALVGLVAAQEEKKAEAAKFQYIGAAKCKMCHNTAAQGKQYDIWAASPHAKAFELLKSEKALAQAKAKGIADPQKDPACLKCHSTAFAVSGEGATITQEEGVSCESCHGPGSEYKSKKVKEGIKAGTIKAESVGLWTVSEKTCTTCHIAEGNENFKGFKYEEAVKKIAHPKPAEAPAAK